MTSTIALIGKSGSGKTTIAKGFLKLIQTNFPNSSILAVDNDLTLELSDSFGIKTKNTIYGIKSGKHEYKTGIPNGMSKQEYIEWALEDIIIQADENTDVIASWLITPKDCKCPSTKLIRDSMAKLVERYDFVIFDCEYDLKYLNSLIDSEIDEAIIICEPKKESIQLASKIADSSKKYAPSGQMGVILNKVNKNELNCVADLLSALELDLIGYIENTDSINEVVNSLELLYPRLNLPQIDK